MSDLIDLFNLLEITRNQPQYGYTVAGGNARLGNLAEHHYLVTLFGWQLTTIVNKKGAKIDIEKVLKFCLLHDIGELFGGDIGMYYVKANPKARTLAKKFEEENQKFLAKYFQNTNETSSLSEEILNSHSDEAHIAKLADYLECTHYKLFTNQLNKKRDLKLIVPKLREKIEKISNASAKKALSNFINSWERKMSRYNSFLDASTSALGV